MQGLDARLERGDAALSLLEKLFFALEDLGRVFHLLAEPRHVGLKCLPHLRRARLHLRALALKACLELRNFTARGVPLRHNALQGSTPRCGIVLCPFYFGFQALCARRRFLIPRGRGPPGLGKLRLCRLLCLAGRDEIGLELDTRLLQL